MNLSSTIENRSRQPSGAVFELHIAVFANEHDRFRGERLFDGDLQRTLDVYRRFLLGLHVLKFVLIRDVEEDGEGEGAEEGDDQGDEPDAGPLEFAFDGILLHDPARQLSAEEEADAAGGDEDDRLGRRADRFRGPSSPTNFWPAITKKT